MTNIYNILYLQNLFGEVKLNFQRLRLKQKYDYKNDKDIKIVECIEYAV